MAGKNPDLRKKPRRHFGYRAKIYKDKDSPAFACAISDISDGGARLNLKDEVDLPDSFFLLFTPSGSAHRRCHVIWRDGLTLGVKFSDGR